MLARMQVLRATGMVVILSGTLWAQGGQGRSGSPQTGQAAQQQVQQQAQTAQQTRLTQQMQQTVQRMGQLQQRAQTLATAMRTQAQTRTQATERDRLMLGTCDALEQQARQMRQLGERAQEMMQNREFASDPQMRRDMERLRQRLHTMADEMDGSLQLMERMRERVRTRTADPAGPPG